MHNEISELNDLLEAGELVACRYRVERCGRNHPLGELYRCHDETADRPVLLQRLRKEFASPDVRDRLFETRSSAAMEMSAIADILDYGEDFDGRPFLVTAWSDDASLADIERPLSFREAVGIVERVAAALEPVHRARLAHGGIEPNSILVDDARELTGLLDFGLVPALETGVTKIRALPLLVSPAYAAPELIRGEAIGPAADVYALGILLWELIFGSAPFRGPTLRVLDSHLNRAVPDIELPFDAPASFEWILRRMLAKDSGDRFADAGEVAAQLRVYTSMDDVVLMADDIVEHLDHINAIEHGEHGEHDEQDDEATVAFARALDEDSRLVLPAITHPAQSAVLPFDPPPARRGIKRLAALAGVACATLLIWWGVGVRGADLDSDAARGPVTTYSAIPVEQPELAVGAAPIAPGQVTPGPAQAAEAAPHTKLSTASLRSRKSELYRRVDQRCVDGRMRRTIKLIVRVAPTGEVDTVNVVGGMASTKLGRCVRQQAQRLEFPATEEGGRYTYTLRLR